MGKALLDFWSQHTALAVGAIVSILLLATFLLFQYNDLNVLKLESRWLLVAGIPLLAALIVGGYIKSFKGFGVELEASLSKPVTNIEMTATEAMEEVVGDDKRGIEYLNRMSAKERKSISRLVLTQGLAGYYDHYVLFEYFNALSNLKYIEIRNDENRFIALLPISEFKLRNQINQESISELISVLEQSRVLQRYSRSAITTFITQDTGLVEALKIMRRARIQKIVVLDENSKFQGILMASSVERRIADSVLQAKANT